MITVDDKHPPSWPRQEERRRREKSSSTKHTNNAGDSTMPIFPTTEEDRTLLRVDPRTTILGGANTPLKTKLPGPGAVHRPQLLRPSSLPVRLPAIPVQAAVFENRAPDTHSGPQSRIGGLATCPPSERPLPGHRHRGFPPPPHAPAERSREWGELILRGLHLLLHSLLHSLACFWKGNCRHQLEHQLEGEKQVEMMSLS